MTVPRKNDISLCLWRSSTDPHDKREYFVVCHSGHRNDWLQDKTIPLLDVLQTFEIYSTDVQSHTGEWIRPSKQMLFNSFSTEDEIVIIEKILTEGYEEVWNKPIKNLSTISTQPRSYPTMPRN